MPLLPDAIVGSHYRIIRLLGAGTFGQTYLAEDLHASGRYRAVKHFYFTSSDPEQFTKAKELFEREATVLLALTDPPRNSHIPRFFAFFDENQQFYLVQELIQGRTLREELDQKTRFQEDIVAELLQDVLEVLKFLHSQRIIHRDIKPENLMRREPDGCLFLIDFGSVKEVVAQTANYSPQKKPTRILSEGYTPIEQFQGGPEFNSDIYALGMTALEALTGLEPSKLKDPHTGQVIWPNQPQVSERLKKILEKMVHEDCRKGRYQSADAVLHDIKDFRRTWVVSPPAPPPVPPLPVPTRPMIPLVVSRLTGWAASIPLGLKLAILSPLIMVIAWQQGLGAVSSIVRIGEKALIAVGRNAAQAGSVSFVCKPNANGTHTTFVLTENGEREFIRWRSDDFTLAGYPPKERCEQVTNRMNQYIASGSARYVTYGMINKQPVICVTDRSGGGCKGLLYTLKPRQDGKGTLRALLEINRRNFTNDPMIEGKSCRTYVDFKAWLGGNSKYAEVACSPQ